MQNTAEKGQTKIAGIQNTQKAIMHNKTIQ